jgi:putative addiction module component (TIGR02574 family)
MDYQSVLNEIETWPIHERILLIQDLCERLARDEYEPALTEEMRAELDRRIEELDRNPELGVPWDEAKARALARVRK